MDDIAAFTRREFCAAHRMSESAYFELKRAGRGPREMRLGARGVRITKEAAAEWRRRMEEIAAEEIAAAESASLNGKEKDAEESTSSDEEAA